LLEVGWSINNRTWHYTSTTKLKQRQKWDHSAVHTRSNIRSGIITY